MYHFKPAQGLIKEHNGGTMLDFEMHLGLMYLGYWELQDLLQILERRIESCLAIRSHDLVLEK